MANNSIEIAVIGFGRPDLLREQHRLLYKYVGHDFGLSLIDNTPKADLALQMQAICKSLGITYLRSPSQKHLHNEALNFAALHVMGLDCDFVGFLDHDVFPRRQTTLTDKLNRYGFFGVGQTHPPTSRRYLWPGLCFFSKEWLNGRELNFDGIRGEVKRDDGDTGSENWSLFSDVDWQTMFHMEHGYKAIREPDSFGLQSWGIEMLGDWLHVSNSSHWMAIPNPGERDRIVLEMIRDL